MEQFRTTVDHVRDHSLDEFETHVKQIERQIAEIRIVLELCQRRVPDVDLLKARLPPVSAPSKRKMTKAAGDGRARHGTSG